MNEAGAKADPRRALPAVDALAARARELDPDLPTRVVLGEARKELDRLRRAIGNGFNAPDADAVARSVALASRLLLADAPRPVINATGVIIHTNLGRAPLADSALEAVRRAAEGYSDLEFDLEEGTRGSRRGHVEGLLRELSGAEAALVLNNNAGAVFLCLSAIAHGRDVVVSRGEAVEIGGSFRIPDILAQSGARLVDVGTTNRTRVSDYEQATGPATALFLKVHRSNFKVVGFTEEAPLSELCALGGRLSVPVMNDLGSGSLLDTAPFGLDREPMVQESVAAGAALTTFSGDKLLGGPQAGVVVGAASLVERIAHHPLARALRPDKMCLAALRATLIHYLKGDALQHIPVWKMIGALAEELESRARQWGAALSADWAWQVVPARSAVGGGSLPGQTLPTFALRISPGSTSPDRLARALRHASPPVIARVEDDHLFLDPRTVPERDDALVQAALKDL